MRPWKKEPAVGWTYVLRSLMSRKELWSVNPRRNALLKEGSKSDKIDARKLALLRSGMLRAAYDGENGLGTLRELARSYLTISKDMRRVMSRLKALYRWAFPARESRSIHHAIASSG